MRITFGIGLLLLLTSAGSTGAQSVDRPDAQAKSGIDAYNRGDFGTAIGLLKPMVFDFVALDRPADPNPWATFYLARMAERGEGMAVDYPLACALLHYASIGFDSRFQHASAEVSRTAEADVCARVPDTEELQALSTKWFMDGITSTQWAIDAERWVVLDRTGFHVHRRDQQRGIPWGFPVVATRHMRHTELRLPDGKERHFIELFWWISQKVEGHIERDLIWVPFEIVETGFAVVGVENKILTVVDGPYPMGDLPADLLNSVVLTPSDSGEVEWSHPYALKKAIGSQGLRRNQTSQP